MSKADELRGRIAQLENDMAYVEHDMGMGATALDDMLDQLWYLEDELADLER